jgi:hypothetical protein
MKKRSRVLACAVAALAFFIGAHAASEEYTLNIDALPLNAALKEFSRQTGLQIYLKEEPKILTAPLKGQYTADAALKELLGSSGLSFTRVNDRTIAVTAVSPTSSVRGTQNLREQKAASSQFIRLADTTDPSAPTSALFTNTAETTPVDPTNSEGRSMERESRTVGGIPESTCPGVANPEHGYQAK